jgi:uncharacterized membrane protein YfcA
MAEDTNMHRRVAWFFRLGIVLFAPLGAFIDKRLNWILARAIELPFGLILGMSYLYLLFFPCPHCGERFSSRPGLGRFFPLLRILFSNKCANCGADSDAPRDAE